MKKLGSILMLAASLTAVNTFGQGAFFLSNFGNGSTIPDTAVNGTNGAAATTFFVEVLGGTNATSLTPIGIYPTSSPTTFTNNQGAGFFDYGVGVVSNANFTAFFEVRAFQGPTGTTYDTALIRGTSGVFSNPTGANPAGLFPGAATTLDIPGAAIQLAVVPEPSTIALGVLGAAALLVRRRKSA